MLTWLKLVMGGKASLIKKMDDLEPMLTEHLESLKGKIGTMESSKIAKSIVDKIQRRLCVWMKVEPKDVGLLDSEGV